MAGVGQRLNITVFEFGSYGYLAPAGSSSSSVDPGGSASAAAASADVECVVVVEPESRQGINICPRARRQRSGGYASTNRSVELYFKRVGSKPTPLFTHHTSAAAAGSQRQQHQQSDDRRFIVQFTGMHSLVFIALCVSERGQNEAITWEKIHECVIASKPCMAYSPV